MCGNLEPGQIEGIGSWWPETDINITNNQHNTKRAPPALPRTHTSLPPPSRSLFYLDNSLWLVEGPWRRSVPAPTAAVRIRDRKWPRLRSSERGRRRAGVSSQCAALLCHAMRSPTLRWKPLRFRWPSRRLFLCVPWTVGYFPSVLCQEVNRGGTERASLSQCLPSFSPCFSPPETHPWTALFSKLIFTVLVDSSGWFQS